MDDLISRQAVIDELHKHFNDGFKGDRWWNSTHVLSAINKVPSAEPQIIRCKDCAYFVKPIDCGYCAEWEHTTDEDEFCSRAERRTDG